MLHFSTTVYNRKIFILRCRRDPEISRETILPKRFPYFRNMKYSWNNPHRIPRYRIIFTLWTTNLHYILRRNLRISIHWEFKRHRAEEQSQRKNWKNNAGRAAKGEHRGEKKKFACRYARFFQFKERFHSVLFSSRERNSRLAAFHRVPVMCFHELRER